MRHQLGSLTHLHSARGWDGPGTRRRPPPSIWNSQALRQHLRGLSLESDFSYGSWFLQEETELPGHLRAKHSPGSTTSSTFPGPKQVMGQPREKGRGNCTPLMGEAAVHTQRTSGWRLPLHTATVTTRNPRGAAHIRTCTQTTWGLAKMQILTQ